MALPKLNTPTYELDLPSTGEKIKFRPFLVKEQKLLLIAQESEDDKQIMETMQKLVGSCTFGKIDAIVSPLFDIEYVFLKLRSKSVGSKIKVNILCPDDEETQVPVDIDLDEVECQMTEDHTNVIKITDKVKMVMGYPQLLHLHNLKEMKAADTFKLVSKCVNEIHDGDTIHNRVDIKDKELEEFVDQMDTKQLQRIMDFFETMPKIRHVVSVTNPNTKVTSDVSIEGMNNFLE